MLIDLPSQKPARLTPTAQIDAPTMFAVANFRCGILPVPASMGTTVRTNGMKRASTTARGPRLSKKSWARSRYSVLKNRASGVKSRVPKRWPMP